MPHGFKIVLRCIYCYIMLIGVLLFASEPHRAIGGHRRALLTSSYCLLKVLSPFAGDQCQVTQSQPKCVVGLCCPSGLFMLTYGEENWNSSSHKAHPCHPSLFPWGKPLGHLLSSGKANKKCGLLLWLLAP